MGYISLYLLIIYSSRIPNGRLIATTRLFCLNYILDPRVQNDQFILSAFGLGSQWIKRQACYFLCWHFWLRRPNQTSCGRKCRTNTVSQTTILFICVSSDVMCSSSSLLTKVVDKHSALIIVDCGLNRKKLGRLAILRFTRDPIWNNVLKKEEADLFDWFCLLLRANITWIKSVWFESEPVVCFGNNWMLNGPTNSGSSQLSFSSARDFQRQGDSE